VVLVAPPASAPAGTTVPVAKPVAAPAQSGPPSPAQASGTAPAINLSIIQLPDWLLDPSKALFRLFGGLLQKIADDIQNALGGFLEQYLFQTSDMAGRPGRALTENPAVQTLNRGMTAMADALLVVTIIWGSFRSMWDRSLFGKHRARTLFPRLLAAVVLVNFSLTFTQLAVDLNNAMVKATLGIGSQDTSRLFHLTLQSPPDARVLFLPLLLVAYELFLVVILLTYVVRQVLLMALVAVAPMAALCHFLPETASWAEEWLKLFLATVFMQWGQVVVLKASLLMTLSGDLLQLLWGIGTLLLVLKVPGAFNSATHGGSFLESQGKHALKAVRKAMEA
jgi:hypothetical protein